MIVTVTLNAAIDRVLMVSDLRIGRSMKGKLISSVPAGKGVNVSRYLAAFEVPSIATGFVGRREMALYETSFRDTPITSTLIEVPTPTRISTTILSDAKTGETHIREEGFPVPAEKKMQLRELLFELASAHGPFVLSGSLPPDFSPAELTEIITGLKSRHVGVIVDASGTALQSALAAECDLVAPNEEELSELVGQPVSATAAVVDAARSLLDNTPEVAVKRGRKGGILVTREGAWSASTGLEDARPESTVGAGDAFLAAFLTAYSRDESPQRRLACAVAAGCASVLQNTVGKIDIRDYETCLTQVEVRKL